MELNNEQLQVKVVLPDHPTVRQLLKYDSERDRLVFADASLYENLWGAARMLVEELECEYLEMGADLDALTDPKAAKAVEWIGRAVFSYRQDVENVPKN